MFREIYFKLFFIKTTPNPGFMTGTMYTIITHSTRSKFVHCVSVTSWEATYGTPLSGHAIYTLPQDFFSC